MRVIPLILTVLLAAAWAYTSWYWYTCNIKGFCSNNTGYENTEQAQPQESVVTENREEISENINSDISEESEFNTGALVDSNSPKLSAEDVLLDPLPKEIESEDEETLSEIDEQSGEIEQSGTGEILQQQDVNSGSGELNVTQEEGGVEEENGNSQESINICVTPLLGPIGLQLSNNTQEVEALELFLISRGEEIQVDGIYDEDDFEAIKRFQLEYKEDVLEPWGIENPTGYVGKTSIKKINEIACK